MDGVCVCLKYLFLNIYPMDDPTTGGDKPEGESCKGKPEGDKCEGKKCEGKPEGESCKGESTDATPAAE